MIEGMHGESEEMKILLRDVISFAPFCEMGFTDSGISLSCVIELQYRGACGRGLSLGSFSCLDSWILM